MCVRGRSPRSRAGKIHPLAEIASRFDQTRVLPGIAPRPWAAPESTKSQNFTLATCAPSAARTPAEVQSVAGRRGAEAASAQGANARRRNVGERLARAGHGDREVALGRRIGPARAGSTLGAAGATPGSTAPPPLSRARASFPFEDTA